MTDPSVGTKDGEAELLFRAITEAADNANIGVVVVRRSPTRGPRDVEILYSNRAVEGLTGYERAESMRRPFWSFVPETELARARALQAARLRGDAIPRSFEFAIQHKSGRCIPVEVAVGTTELDHSPAMVLFLIDISSRREAEAALRHSQAQFKQVVTNAPDGIYILRWPTIVFANPAGARILDLHESEQAVGINLLERMTPTDVPIAHDRLERMKAGKSFREPYQYRGRNPNGREFAVEISSIPIEFEGGPAVLAFARDVTERNLMLEKLHGAEQLAAVNTLAAGVAHEINNPLAYVLLNLEFMQRELPELGGDPERTALLQRRLADTRHGAERVKHIVRSLQALTCEDEGLRAAVDLDQVIEQALNVMQRELQPRAAVAKHLERVPCVLGDPTRLEQLLLNLLGNAEDAIRDSRPNDGRIEISLTNGAAGMVTIAVSDNGCGMTESVLARAFEPFFTTKPLGVGAGLGLPICKRIVEDLDGRIKITSQPNGGTCVRVLLPEAPASARPPAPPRRRGRVLVVDDEPAVAESLRHALSDEHDVETAASAALARAAFERTQDYDVVLCDLLMPVESGADLYNFARQSYPLLADRFVFMTGGVFTTRAVSFLEESQRPRIDKPFALDRLRALVDEFILQGS